jgi:membrane-associated phospholipid phosphatase
VTDWGTSIGRGLANTHGRLANRIGARPAFVASLALGAGIAAAAAIVGTRIYDSVAGSDGIEALDVPILHRAMRLRSGPVDAAAAGIAYAFGPVGLPILGLATAAAIARRERSTTPLILVTAAGVGSLLMTLGGKDVVKRHRPPRRDAIPPYEWSPSFPSGHTLNTTAIAGVLAYLLVLREKRTGPQGATIAAAVGTAATVGMSRVLLGAHWFTDVLMGWVTGSGWLALVITSHRLHLTVTRPQGSHATESAVAGETSSAD